MRLIIPEISLGFKSPCKKNWIVEEVFYSSFPCVVFCENPLAKFDDVRYDKFKILN